MKHELTDFLLHRPPMVLLDELVCVGHEKTISRVEISEKSCFFDNGSVPAWVSIEYMAQTIALYGGFESREKNKKVSMGFLLGVRKFKTYRESFKLGEQLQVEAVPLLVDSELNTFECFVYIGETIVAEGKITTIRPNEETFENIMAGI